MRASVVSSLPSRLIELGISDNSALRLVETATESITEPYATLSYCWGGANPFRLTTASLQEFKSGFNILSLPRTIFDAVNDARDLGIRYLWVDSLCIIQDSAADWELEVNCMSEVYRNSYVTIAALGATNTEEGLFTQRDPLTIQPCWMARATNGQDFYVCSSMSPIDLNDMWWHSAPLHKRGWVMQERVLSPRTLNFGVAMIWECCQGVITEYDNQNIKMHMGNTGSTSRSDLTSIKDMGFLSAPFPQDATLILGRWRQKLLYYSSSELSVKSDRLAAVNGIVEFIRDQTGWTNVYGLWKPFLTFELLWKFHYPSGRDEKRQPRLFGVAPTWSWGSVNTGVDRDPLMNQPGYWKRFRAGTQVTKKRDSIQVRTIQLHLTLKMENITNTKSYLVGDINKDAFCFRQGYEEKGGNCVTHHDIWPIPEGPYFFAPLTIDERRGGAWDVHGLALVRNATGSYERFGYVETGITSDCYRDFEKEVEEHGAPFLLV